MKPIFSYFLNLTFCKRNNAKIIILTIFYYFPIIINIFLVSSSNFTKKRIYEHIWIYFIYKYICLYMFIYIYIYYYI